MFTTATVTETKKFPSGSTVFSLIQPTGKIHLGNYLGAVSNWKDISQADEDPSTRYIFGTADLHALTSVKDQQVLKNARHEAIASLLATGISPERCIIYHQSSVPEHAQLSWVLTCLTSMGALNRMTQWKSKSKVDEMSSISDLETMGKTKAGVFTYPILQSADVLIYKSTHVPVGEDQAQHLELTRTIAQAFNSTYKTDFFPIPKSVLTPTKKILSLKNPSKKMSKSDADQNSCIYITETPDSIAKKIRKAATDSIQGKVYFDPENRPGVSNLINIVSGLSRKSIDETVKDLDWVKDHKQLKDHVTEMIVEEFKPKRHIFDDLMSDVAYLEQVTNKGREKAKAIAGPNMKEIERLIGLD
ncbi:Tryptophan--tRNA ligase, mitochondrial [Yamadazyma tenuis]|uniref:Tryptophan--tRNA ligase, mitochondrial n=1 Tax=Candida tenuis (strain ATCC 10573 / BCRC 21748 / CBS 615 / JCM 9827 / NBRC 10315 / NRRL Y-1498 / VKM Y-70) TaxID=590646 RepID=G3AZ17_CANTC|nr:uncharacterized protein CANTEDRAFT_118997 [Yamadazyma tenuis ATCC 10573]EGV65982.1 hypothetical protein CANTEDRAFT_118997 [Yamadazyma tenuis ATCC 10573]WEJ95678.1 Tryptophan--tRNA ligase, mitochondrial [Yamadazyma tenuis]